MSKFGELVDFDEFRVFCDGPRAGDAFVDAVLQQREHFRDRTAAEKLLRPGALGVKGWAEWPN